MDVSINRLNPANWIEYAAQVMEIEIARIAVFRRQIFVTPIARYGDSGALVLDLNNNVLGMVFACSRTHSVANPIEEVQSQLGILVSERIVSE